MAALRTSSSGLQLHTIRHKINILGAPYDKTRLKIKTIGYSTAMLATSQLAFESYINDVFELLNGSYSSRFKTRLVSFMKELIAITKKATESDIEICFHERRRDF